MRIFSYLIWFLCPFLHLLVIGTRDTLTQKCCQLFTHLFLNWHKKPPETSYISSLLRQCPLHLLNLHI